MQKGSITVFASLCMLFVMSALLVLLEGARIYGLEKYVDWKGSQAMECVAAEYQPYVWEKFHLLMLDGAYGSQEFDIGKAAGEIRANIDKNTIDSENTHFFNIRLKSIFKPEYLLLTDNEGDVFLDMTASYMKDHLPQEIARKIYQNYEEEKALEQDSINVEQTIDHAKELLEEARREQEQAAKNNVGQQEKSSGEESSNIENIERESSNVESGRQNNTDTIEKSGIAQSEKDVPDNPLELIEELRRSMSLSPLNVIIADPDKLSQKAMELSNSLERREREEGSMTYESSGDWYRKILVLEYAQNYFSSYTDTEKNHAFSYELEYLAGGKEQERDNLAYVIQRLLVSRMAANVTYLLSDAEKMQMAQALSASLAGFTGNPAIIKTVEIAIVGAWAYLEGIQDIRTLLDGGKIALIKSAAQWTTDLMHLPEALKKDAKAKACTNGIRYEGYLKQILYLVSEETLAYRMMDVIEQNLIRTEYGENARMDHMIVCLRDEMEFSAKPLFSTLSLIKGGNIHNYTFHKEKEVSYLP